MGRIREMQLGIHEVFYVSLGIAKGMCFLHHVGVVHGELKSTNVLMSDSGEALIDVSNSLQAQALQKGHYSSAVARRSMRWTPCEYFLLPDDENFHPTQKSDVWGFGMTVMELLTRDAPYAHFKTDGAVLRAISQGELPRKPDIDDSDPDAGLKHFMWLICLKCWRLNPEERPSMREILEEMLDYPLEDTHSMPSNEEF
ncbi:kinase-like protein [Schizopora paradoxa]|uniref:Kinase-like protein n=1 Tax=Schizopora paradoxa TaxID=27342 RepID=A0A0H2SEM0_9AGAM|nr:kinase-like protein [Schizopora paradoxa]